ncbi:uncharacterized protein LOC132760298 [Ruditapes philippinarum]|uniref:uncharacterized protein LOC132760298 n=1 Tax=Ruditapes philippinarum TaxID=129788 RepID=UPI00295C19C7|nr:uncharacterized protein LOC132760298 [Ruditapes philippinarum]
MDKLQHIENKEKLQTMFLPLFDKAFSKYREDSLVYFQDKYEDKLLAEIKAYLDMMKNQINKKCKENGMKELSKMYDEMQKRNKSRYLTDKSQIYSYYEADMEKLKQDFFEAKKLYDKDVIFECFDEFLKSKHDEKTTRYRDATGQKYKDQYDEFCRESHWRTEHQFKRIRDKELVKRDQYLEMQLAELRLKYEKLHKSLSQKDRCSIM